VTILRSGSSRFDLDSHKLELGMHAAVVLLVLQVSVSVSVSGVCEPAPDIQRELQAVAATSGAATATANANATANVVVSDVTDFDHNIAAVRELRARHPEDLFVNERYQDAVDRHGIEGHVKAMVQEYQDRAMQAPDDVVARYLFARALIGRNTQAAVQALAQIVADHPEFAPAHRALAATYATRAYRDEERARAEQERWRTLCPGSVSGWVSGAASGSGSGAELASVWPVAVAAPSPLIAEAERLLAADGDAARVMTLANQGIRDDEWRLQRMRPFDWFSVEEKRQAQRELLATYWRFWSLQVRCHRKAGRSDQASQVLAQMERRAGTLYKSQESASWDALAILARLYAEGGQQELADQKIEGMRQLLAQVPDADRASELAKLQKDIGGR
jgi:hypothetical protein